MCTINKSAHTKNLFNDPRIVETESTVLGVSQFLAYAVKSSSGKKSIITRAIPGVCVCACVCVCVCVRAYITKAKA